jgi:N-acetylmuramoyl-L-alanine amidase
MKVYLSGSTQQDNQGVLNYGTEEYRMQQLADKVKLFMEQGKGNFEIYRNNGSMSLQQIIEDSNSKSPNVHVALHSNAGGGHGTECYYSNYPSFSASSKKLADLIYNAVATITAQSDRGCLADTVLYSHGLAETRDTTAVACLIEIMFHDNETDVKDYLSKIDIIAKAIAKAIYAYFGTTYAEESTRETERDIAVKRIKEISKYSDTWIKEFDKLAQEGLNIWGLLNKYKGDK